MFSLTCLRKHHRFNSRKMRRQERESKSRPYELKKVFKVNDTIWGGGRSNFALHLWINYLSLT